MGVLFVSCIYIDLIYDCWYDVYKYKGYILFMFKYFINLFNYIY